MEHQLGFLAPVALAWGEFAVLLLPMPLIVFANWHESPPAGPGGGRAAARLLGSAVWLLLAMVSAACGLFGLILFALGLSAGTGLARYGLVLFLTGLAAGLLVADSTRRGLARFLPIDPDSALDATALVLSTILVGSQLASQLAADVLAEQAASGTALGPLDLVAQELPFLLAALLGVGLFIRRGPRATLVRLGLVRPSGWQVIAGLGAAGLFFAFGNGIEELGRILTPGVAEKVQAANDRLFGQLGNPAGIATIALAAGICEETLFRGAMQPRLGILWTSLVFAAVHTQYGLSLDTLAVFILAIGLGLLRRLANTTTSTICHVTYNAVVGVGVGGPWMIPALALEAGLLLAGLAAFFTGRLGSLRTAA